MKVRCIKLLDSRGLPTTRSAWVKIGGTYHVLSIWIEPGQTKLRLIGEEPTPALFEVEMFEVVSSSSTSKPTAIASRKPRNSPRRAPSGAAKSRRADGLFTGEVHRFQARSSPVNFTEYPRFLVPVNRCSVTRARTT